MGTNVTPQNTTAEIASVIDTAQQTVIDRFTRVEEYADGAMETAEGFLDNLANAADSQSFPIPILSNPELPTLSYQFNPGDAPTAPDTEIALPAFPENPIMETFALVTNIENSLSTALDAGVTGLNAAVEQQIWERGQERDRIAVDEAKEKISAEWSKRGFDLPDGVLVSQLSQAEIEYRNKSLDLSRDVAIKQAELAFQNTQFIKKSILEMNQILVAAVTEGNKITIGKYQADIEGYKMQVQAAISKIDEAVKAYEASGAVYKSKAEAQAAIANVDVKAAEVNINSTIAQMQLFLKQAEIMIERSRAIAQLRTAAAEAGGRIAASLAAGALSAVSVQAHLSATGNASKSYSGQESLSESHSYTGE